MNIASEMNSEDVLRIKLEVLRREHRDLDDAIRALENQGGVADQFTTRRLKKQKLILKDRIAALEDQLTPDIIA
ncbi:YdcH family protein [Actibacterium sp.]|uniref:YdcH family protein n=1 Tax=Actibacterium sp. TaxID=1872125 RepID=UPI003563D3A5